MAEHMHALIRYLTNQGDLVAFIIVFFEACWGERPAVDEHFEISKQLANNTANYKLFTRKTLGDAYTLDTIEAANNAWRAYAQSQTRGDSDGNVRVGSIWVPNDQWETMTKATQSLIQQMTGRTALRSEVILDGDCTHMEYNWGQASVNIDEIVASDSKCYVYRRIVQYLVEEAKK